ncbi:MAG: glycoside hydrolase family 5 protein, partial [Proteobacteria bacterium]|nr:glycoside hydrolase family 5 protein [Pseudomonadota bacterium]
IDWHDHHAHTHPYDARAFFEAMAQIYGDYPNVIYEIYNEPLNVSWRGTLKPYAEFIIEGIRQHDPDNLILVGTPVWSQQPDAAVGHSIDDPNVAYVFHFYAGMHSFSLRLKAEIALGTGLPVFISEWGLESGAFVDNDHHGEIRLDVLTPWLDWMKEKRLSHLMWSCYDKDEPMSILKAGASPLGGWTDDDLTPIGRFMKEYYSAPPPTPLDTDSDNGTDSETDSDTETE